MIDSYGDRQNPCTFCTGAEGDDAADTKEYLELSLTGNDTTLIVREVSAEDVTRPGEGEDTADHTSEVTEPVGSQRTSLPTAPLMTSARTSKSPRTNRESNLNSKIDSLYTKKWSGNMYYEEEIRRLRDLQYDKDVKEALRMRRLWHSFQLQLLKDRRREILKSSGPEWWQEPSTKQIVLATTLRDVIKADYEEEVTGRTRQWLLDLGVTTRLTPRQVRSCMRLSILEPVDFLLETHALVVKAQNNTKKKSDLQRPFSVDERLLLSAVCVLQLPCLLTMLHYILPPPQPVPADPHSLELLYGDVADETIRYASPYMEPLPFRNRVDFEDWAFGKIISALLPVLLGDQGVDCRGSDISGRITCDLRKSLSTGGDKAQNRLSIISNAPSIAMLLCYCLSKRKRTDSLRVIMDEESVSRRRTFGRRLTFIGGKKQSHYKQVEPYKNFIADVPAHSSLKSASDIEPTATVTKDATPTAVKKEKSSIPVSQEAYDEYNWANQPWQGEYNQTVPANAYQYPDQAYYGNYSNYYGNTAYDEQYNYYDNADSQIPPEQQRTSSKNKERGSKGELSINSSKITVGVGLSNSASHDPTKTSGIEQDDAELLANLKNIWEEIGACPEKEQLHMAMKILTEMGDPLAQLPKIEKLPTLQRWAELRRGKNRILSKKTKWELLQVSRGMWKSVHFGNTTRGPKVDMKKSEERKLTWDRKKWLEAQVKREKQNYFTRIRQEKVDNARSFFPTMLNHYDYGSRLNRGFRDVYFTYLPAREADTLAYRPWLPSETTNARR